MPYVRPEFPDEIRLTYENFPDDNFRAELRTLFTKIDNDVITENVQSCTSLNIRYKNITNLKGLEFFYYLTELNIEGNTIANGSLDLRNLQSLQKLEATDCKLKSITLPDTNTLITIYLSNNNLTSIDVSSYTELLYLHINNNELTSLDVSKNSKLNVLQFTDTTGKLKINTVDVANKPNLRNILIHCQQFELEDLYTFIEKLPKTSTNKSLTVDEDGGYNAHNKISIAAVEKANKKKWTLTQTGVLVLDDKHFPDKALRDAVIAGFKELQTNNPSLTKLKALTIQEGTVIIGSVASEITNAKKFFALSIRGATSVDLTNINYLQKYCDDFEIYGPENGTTTVKNMDLSKFSNLYRVLIYDAKVESGSFDFSSTKVRIVFATNITLGSSVNASLKLGTYDLSKQREFANVDLTNCPFSSVYFGNTNNTPFRGKSASESSQLNFNAVNCKKITSLDLSGITTSNANPLYIPTFSCPNSSVSSVKFPTAICLDGSDLWERGLNLSNNKLTSLTLPLELPNGNTYARFYYSIDLSNNQLSNITFASGTTGIRFENPIDVRLYGNKFNVNNLGNANTFLKIGSNTIANSMFEIAKPVNFYLYSENKNYPNNEGYAPSENNYFTEAYVKKIKTNYKLSKFYKYNQQGVIQDYYVTN